MSTASPCPACRAESAHLLHWPYSGLNDSVFNYDAEIRHCPGCGLVYTDNISDAQLARFYGEECLYSESGHFDIHAPSNVEKYRHYRDVLVRAGLSDAPLADVGCGRGGFLIWMHANGWKGECCGVDVDAVSMPLPDAQQAGVSFAEGSAVRLPFADGSRQVLSYFHVLEHIRDVDRVLDEASRVLADDGALLIEVPDAERYGDYPTGTAFWMAIREHVYHFSPEAMCHALQRHGFGVVDIVREELPTPEFSYPSLVVVARKDARPGPVARPPATTGIADYALHARTDLAALADKIGNMANDADALTFWGCSSVVYSLLPSMDRRAIRLCDASPTKQRSTWNGVTISDPATLPAEGMLIIASYLHRDAIRASALQLGWDERSIFILK